MGCVWLVWFFVFSLSCESEVLNILYVVLACIVRVSVGVRKAPGVLVTCIVCFVVFCPSENDMCMLDDFMHR